jgi:hypothetical protein
MCLKWVGVENSLCISAPDGSGPGRVEFGSQNFEPDPTSVGLRWSPVLTLDRSEPDPKVSVLTRPVRSTVTQTHPQGTDVLQWWREKASEYPCLAAVAGDYLAIPATSAPVERVFSSGTDLVQDKSGSLKEETIRVCMCLKSWLKDC